MTLLSRTLRIRCESSARRLLCLTPAVLSSDHTIHYTQPTGQSTMNQKPRWLPFPVLAVCSVPQTGERTAALSAVPSQSVSHRRRYRCSSVPGTAPLTSDALPSFLPFPPSIQHLPALRHTDTQTHTFTGPAPSYKSPLSPGWRKQPARLTIGPAAPPSPPRHCPPRGSI